MNILTPNMSSMVSGGAQYSSSSPLARQESVLSRGSTPRASLRSSARGNRASRDVSAGNEVVDGRFVGEVKAGRVKVGIRCRPAFQDEIDFAKGQFVSIVDTIEEEVDTDKLGSVKLTLLSGKQRDFMFDYVFGQDSSQDSVFNRIARPVVDDVLKGFNGTIFAYGQTGTGKTYTMGILESVEDEAAGVIPRAIARIFDYEKEEQADEVRVTLSFLQLYRETIQDLLAPAGAPGAPTPRGNTPHKVYNDENLVIREDPVKGFYVEGLQEFIVRDYSEAEALINLGLENRAIAPTLMNATSSRSHTVLTLNVEQRGMRTGRTMKNVRSKLLMVDLAGSERVRRTISKGTRLNEARSINSSLSTLGNVIAALAQEGTTHVPYRDSKLTRLLQDSLGGTASTALIATVGPAAMNYSETLSTLLFAARCMAVKTTPIQHEQVDYAEMCAQLQERLSSVESRLNAKHEKQQVRYQQQIRELQDQLDKGGWDDDYDGDGSGVGGLRGGASRQSQANLESVLGHLNDLQENSYHKGGGSGTWMQKSLSKSDDGKVLLPLLSYSFELVKALANDLVNVLTENRRREEQRKIDMIQQFSEEADRESVREVEQAAMVANDPLSEEEASGRFKIGNHLARLTRLEALTRVEGLYRADSGDLSPQLPQDKLLKDDLSKYKSPQELAEALTALHDNISKNTNRLNVMMARKDRHYKDVKDELCSEMVEKRRREEEVVNWSYILKYLLSSSSKLRRQMQAERNLRETLEERVAGGGDSNDGLKAGGRSNAYEGSNRRISSPGPDSGSPPGDRAGMSPLQRVRARMEVMKAEEEDRKKNRGITGVIRRLTGRSPQEKAKRAAMRSNEQAARDAERELRERQGSDEDWSEEEEEDDSDSDSDSAYHFGDTNSGSGDGTYPAQEGSGATGRAGKEARGVRRGQKQEQDGVKSPSTPGTGRGRMSILESKVSGIYRPSPGKQTPVYVEPEREVKGSAFAKRVVSDLGVTGDDADAAAAIIDRVANITPAQLEIMDPATRAQVLRVRADLKLDQYLDQGRGPGPGTATGPKAESEDEEDSGDGSELGERDSESPLHPKNRTPSFSERFPQAADAHTQEYRPPRRPQSWAGATDSQMASSQSHIDETVRLSSRAKNNNKAVSVEARAKKRRGMLDML